jgi:hypothetical protein
MKDSTSHEIKNTNTSPSKEDERLRAEAAYRWGRTPPSHSAKDDSKLPDDHPVHAISLEDQDKMRKKGIDPALKAEMDQLTKGQGKERSFWSKFGLTSTGPWMR